MPWIKHLSPNNAPLQYDFMTANWNNTHLPYLKTRQNRRKPPLGQNYTTWYMILIKMMIWFIFDLNRLVSNLMCIWLIGLSFIYKAISSWRQVNFVHMILSVKYDSNVLPNSVFYVLLGHVDMVKPVPTGLAKVMNYCKCICRQTTEPILFTLNSSHCIPVYLILETKLR